ncbi:hypothetical protein ACH4OY_13135 [Micromonospora rubida]|uniref:Uncharacterized protein n=1 Tax=Micromonospora rubida TaxID=2697657 RepID=A0ABW7SLN6_9ACTN
MDARCPHKPYSMEGARLVGDAVESCHKISHSQELTSPLVAVVLVIAMALEGYALRTAVKEAESLTGAVALYELLGFTTASRSMTLGKAF